MFKKINNLKQMSIYSFVMSLIGIFLAVLALAVALTMEEPKNLWNVEFTNVSVQKNGEVSTSTPRIISTSMKDLVVQLRKTNDSVIYKFRVTNNGSVDAKVKVISDIRPTCVVLIDGVTTDTCSHVNYKLSYSNGTSVGVGDVVKAGTSKEMMLEVKYIGEDNTDMKIDNLDFIVLFEQN